MRSLFVVLAILGLCFKVGTKGEAFEDLLWKNISGEMLEVNTAWVDNQNSQIILMGTNRGVFKTEDGGRTWQKILFGANKKVNFLYVERSGTFGNVAQGNSESEISQRTNKDLIYAGCESGLFYSCNQGKTWKRIYQGGSEPEANCLSLIKLNSKLIYLGTEAGLLRSQDNGRTWHRFSGRLGRLPIWAMAIDRINNFIYLATPEGAYRFRPREEARRIFFFSGNDSQDTDTGLGDEQSKSETACQVNYICTDPNKPQDIYPALSPEKRSIGVRKGWVYLATSKGVFKSEDSGCTWRRLPDFGLLSKEVRFITISVDSVLWAVTKAGIFAYTRGRWQELSLRLPMQDIRFLTVDHRKDIYVAGDKGLFKASDYHKAIYSVLARRGGVYSSAETAQEPTIQQVQQAAIKYAQVVDPAWITAQRRLSRLKAILPDLSLDYDKTISTYNNSKITRFTVGPSDWGISLKWDLGDLIWSEQQRLIDSQVRLMVKLRQDIVDEVTRLYFEHRRLELELVSCKEIKAEDRQNKQLRIKELTALLDGLTGGHFSKKN